MNMGANFLSEAIQGMGLSMRDLPVILEGYEKFTNSDKQQQQMMMKDIKKLLAKY